MRRMGRSICGKGLEKARRKGPIAAAQHRTRKAEVAGAGDFGLCSFADDRWGYCGEVQITALREIGGQYGLGDRCSRQVST